MENILDSSVISRALTFLIPLGVFVLTFSIGMIARKYLYRALKKWASKSSTDIDDFSIEATKSASIIWCVILALYIALDISKIPDQYVQLSGKIFFVLTVISLMIVLTKTSTNLIQKYSAQLDSSVLPVTSLTQNISRIIIFVTGILFILNGLGISVTPILATLGIGGLAVALALQDTLSNIFAGFYIIISRQIRIGDYIKLESSQEGYVTDITWRSTTIRMLANNMVIIPNAKLVQAIVTNYHLPQNDMSVLVGVGVHYNSDLKKVEKITCEVAKQVMQEIPGGIPDFEPFIRFHTFDNSSINFSVILRAKEFVDQYLLKHEFIKKLHERFNQEGIVIPFPIRAINYEQEKPGT